jgi:hypothetical protein
VTLNSSKFIKHNTGKKWEYNFTTFINAHQDLSGYRVKNWVRRNITATFILKTGCLTTIHHLLDLLSITNSAKFKQHQHKSKWQWKENQDITWIMDLLIQFIKSVNKIQNFMIIINKNIDYCNVLNKNMMVDNVQKIQSCIFILSSTTAHTHPQNFIYCCNHNVV